MALSPSIPFYCLSGQVVFLAETPPILTFCSGQLYFFYLIEQNAKAMLSDGIKFKLLLQATLQKTQKLP